MDAIDSVVDPLREFAKDSVRLVKRCHKPDQKGINFFFNYWIVAVKQNRDFKNSGFIFCRIHEGGDSYCNRIRGYGICWVLREVDFYPN
jgi:hypothetical protein